MSEIFSFKWTMKMIDLLLITICSIFVMTTSLMVYLPSDFSYIAIPTSFTALNSMMLLSGITLAVIAIVELIDVIKIISLIRHKLEFSADVSDLSFVKLCLIMIFISVIPLLARIIYNNNTVFIAQELMIFVMNNPIFINIIWIMDFGLIVIKFILCVAYGKLLK